MGFLFTLFISTPRHPILPREILIYLSLIPNSFCASLRIDRSQLRSGSSHGPPSQASKRTQTKRGLCILVARLTAKITQKNFSTLPLLCYNETCLGAARIIFPATRLQAFSVVQKLLQE